MFRGSIASTSTTVASFALSCLLAPPLAAQERDPAAAQALFDQGRALMKAKNYAEACPKLAESQRLDPGMGTQFHLADCYENQGKLASAWANFLEVASLASASNQPDREKAAKARAAKIEPRLPRLTIVVPATSRVAGLQVLRDGVAVGEVQWGSALPVDPGKREVTASAPGRQTYTDTVTVSEGMAATLKVPALQPAPEAAAAAPAPATAPGEPTVPAAPPPAPALPPADQPPAPAQASSGPGPFVIGLGVVGVVGLGAGTVLGLIAKSKYDDSKEHCRPADENLCDAQGVELRDDAMSLGNMSTVGFIVGGVALAGAGVLWIASNDSKEAAHGRAGPLRAGLQMSPSRGSVVLRGSF
jgi:tetratricopeptide (TPR) repeat protein